MAGMRMGADSKKRHIGQSGAGFCHWRQILAGIGIAILLAFLLTLDVLNCFHHGYYTDARPYENVGQSSILGTYSLAEGSYEISFMPAKDYFAGVVLYLENLEKSGSGVLKLEALDASGRLVAAAQAQLSDIPNEHAYKLSMESASAGSGLKKGESYTLRISVRGCDAAPSLILVDEDFRMTESKDDPLLIAFGYGEADFNPQEKVLITLLAIGGILCLLAWGLGSGDCSGAETAFRKKDRKVSLRASALKRMGMCLVLLVLLAWNYSFNSLDGNNDTFDDFQSDSEALVTAGIEAVWKGVANPAGTGLIKLTRIDGESGSQTVFPDDEEWNQGYHRTDPAIRLPISEYTEEYVVPGNSIRFANGEEHAILAVSEAGSEWLTVALDVESPMDAEQLGSLSGARILLSDGTPAPEEAAAPYESQYGLQGKVFQKLSLLVKNESVIETAGMEQALSECEDMLRLLCVLATAGALLLVCGLLYCKYGRLMAGIFYAVFLLSPWVVNFARNLYWVEFTWFLPMAAGLLCSLGVERRLRRVAGYMLVFITIMVKCLCGYEYISSVMLGAILFLLVDLAGAAARRDADRGRLLVRTIFCMGIAALLGFAAAICLHAPVKSGGSLTEGIRMIIQEDVLRRTYGADLNAFESLPDFEQAGLNASAWATICKYFHFKTEIITGIDGSLFPLLCLVPLAMLIWDYKEKKLQMWEAWLYVVSFLVPVSWFVLAKSHSYVHTHMNFVLWYMGYVQICLYVIARHVRDWVRGK